MSEYRAGFIGLVGYPNAGKSSLMNVLVEEKVSIVSKKPQTTRRRVLGIYSDPQGQLVFVDSPGIVPTKKGMNAFIAREASEVMSDSDGLLAILAMDAENVDEARETLDWVQKSGKPWKAVITKSDLKEKAHRKMILEHLVSERGGECVEISNVKPNKKIREDLLKICQGLVPTSQAPLYDIDLFTPENEREMVAEIVREKCFEFLHQEVPFGTAVRIAKYDEDSHAIPRIYAEIMVSRESHKAIAIGEGGLMIKTIGSAARIDIEKLLGTKVFLQLNVSVRENWMNNKSIMKEFGYVHDEKS